MDYLPAATPYQPLHHEECHNIIVNAHLRGVYPLHHPVEEDNGDAVGHDLLVQADIPAVMAHAHQDSFHTTLFQHLQVLGLYPGILV